MIPTKSDMPITFQILRDRVISVPTYSPIGVMASSTPRVNNPIPNTSSAAPKRKLMSIPPEMGVIVKQRSMTINVTGRTDDRASRHLSVSSVWFLCKSASPFAGGVCRGVWKNGRAIDVLYIE